ncbi:MAG TPA: tRNA (adenosine(37)-N6)-threonylcarbamoyltransferase complex dimerization subunit type 1 TsaB [Actinophytocola sp.]|uniref:tRNA (adenosine(37)-N6)-threonylcarbamoyltransferase complex dimerization subunit type 1 TsaB n=1 Tax=Actinophytocola sp. TaxID=1872138 RepID=UPI002DBA3500|nr:tRNA (adenosine(37)-N6)-threonylcarbamoyltransferase complex dimerization subunit type 1 TsaB [Actinophytocola sp.]HEU5472169.1 tRNA (adenosine(37)-N6)-threonylcarbamoyltransferase complex dimerization subunit type 1 TsaB [Actinophytocola sp.]
MLLLAVDTATPAITAGVVALDGGAARVLAERVTVDAKAHGELLTPHLLHALNSAGRELSEVDAVVCGVGPGPFTGLRAGMVTAAALGHALDVAVYPVCSLDAIAAEVPGAPLLVVTDARRREVYWAGYDGTGARVTGPAVERPAELAARLPELGVHRAAGYGARLYAEVLGLAVTGPEHPSPAGLVAAAGPALRAGTPAGPLTPLYLRRPDAVEPGARKRVLR